MNVIFAIIFFSLENQQNNKTSPGLPGGPVVKNLPTSARDMGSIPDLGRSHRPQSNQSHAPQLLSLYSRAQEPQPLSPHAAITEAHAP